MYVIITKLRQMWSIMTALTFRYPRQKLDPVDYHIILLDSVNKKTQ